MVAGLFLVGISSAQVVGGGNRGIGQTGPTVVTAPTHLIVSFKPGTSDALKFDLSNKYGLAINQGHSNKYFSRLELSASVLNAGLKPADFVRILSSNPAIAFAELDVQITPDFIPNDPMFNQQWHHNNTGQAGGTADADVDAVEAWDDLAGINETVVAVCDDAVDIDHEDLKNRIWVNPNEIADNNIDDDGNGYIDDINGWDTADDDNDPRPPSVFDSHGTHVAGIVGAEQNNSKGVSGVAPTVKIMAMRHYAGQGSWMSDLATAIDYAWANGAHVITVSYNIDGFTNALVQAIQRADTADVVYLNSAGNNGQQNPPRQAIRNMADNVIFIAATDNRDLKAGFSNWGTLIEVGAPGVDILSTYPANDYQSISGTSMATPLAAGIVGMIRGKFPSMSDREALDQLINTCDEVSSLTSFIANGRRVNLAKAIGNVVGPTTIDSFAVIMGTLNNGDLNSILDSDDVHSNITAETYSGRGNYAAFEIGATSPKEYDKVKSIKLTVESATNGTGVTQFVTAYNYTKGTWDRLSSVRLTATDNEVEIQVAQKNLAHYVHPTTMKMKFQVTAFVAVKRRGAVPPAFDFTTDQVTVKVG